MGCAGSPGFDFVDFELANREKLLKQFPQAKAVAVIEKLTD